MLSEGFKEAAEKFSVEANIKPPMDLDQLDERIRIRSAIQNGQFQEAMRMVTALHPEILDDNSQLYFHLQVSMKSNGLTLLIAQYTLDSSPLPHLSEKHGENKSRWDTVSKNFIVQYW